MKQQKKVKKWATRSRDTTGLRLKRHEQIDEKDIVMKFLEHEQCIEINKSSCIIVFKVSIKLDRNARQKHNQPLLLKLNYSWSNRQEQMKRVILTVPTLLMAHVK